MQQVLEIHHEEMARSLRALGRHFLAAAIDLEKRTGLGKTGWELLPPLAQYWSHAWREIEKASAHALHLLEMILQREVQCTSDGLEAAARFLNEHEGEARVREDILLDALRAHSELKKRLAEDRRALEAAFARVKAREDA